MLIGHLRECTIQRDHPISPQLGGFAMLSHTHNCFANLTEYYWTDVEPLDDDAELIEAIGTREPHPEITQDTSWRARLINAFWYIFG
jgi:hypothetical protein